MVGVGIWICKLGETMDFITSDRTLKVGDLVFSRYHSGEFLYKVLSFERRFLTKDDLRYSTYKNGKEGDEYNSLVKIEAVANLSITADPNKKLRKNIKSLDTAWVTKVDPKHIEAHIKKLNDLLSEMWP